MTDSRGKMPIIIWRLALPVCLIKHQDSLRKVLFNYILQIRWNFFKITLPEYAVSASFHPFTSLNGSLNSSQLVKNLAPELIGSGAFFCPYSGENDLNRHRSTPSYSCRESGIPIKVCDEAGAGRGVCAAHAQTSGHTTSAAIT